MSVSCGADVNLDKPPSDFDDFAELFEDITDVSEVEIFNPYEAPIGDKKLLTCHGCKVKGKYFELKNNVTVIECSRLGYSSTNPRVYKGNVIDTRTLLKKMHGARTFQEAVNKIGESIVPKDESSVPKGASFELSKGTRAVARTARYEGEKIRMQESRLFLRGCLNEFEGIYKLDERGEIVDITQSEYGLVVKSDEDRHPVKDFKACSHSQEVNAIELADKEEMYNKFYDELLAHHLTERGRIQAHIQKLLGHREACIKDEEIHRLPHPQRSLVERKIEEYTRNLEIMETKIQTIENIKKYLIIDGKYYYPRQRYVLLSDILNHPSTRPGTLFILKVCKNICNTTSKVHGEDRESRHDKHRKLQEQGEVPRIRSHDERLHGNASSRNVVKQYIGDRSSNSSESSTSSKSSKKERERSRSSSGGKIGRRLNISRKKRSYRRIPKKRNKKTRKRKMTRK